MRHKTPRIATRAVLIHQNRLLLVNAWPDGKSDLWCAPGGGVQIGTSLPDNLAREVHEETGLHIFVGNPCLINEFHDPKSGFHQIEVFFRCSTPDPDIDPAWRDPEGVVTDRRWVSEPQARRLRLKPDSLIDVAFGTGGLTYDPLEPIQH